jgi:hypothetical protein
MTHYFTVNVLPHLVEAPWWTWLYVAAIGLMAAAAFTISHLWKN